MNYTTQETEEILSTDNILIITNVITASLALLSEIMGASGCSSNGLIHGLLNCFKKSETALENIKDSIEEII